MSAEVYELPDSGDGNPPAVNDGANTHVNRFRLRTDRLVWRPLDNELVIVDLDGAVYLAANRSASILWEPLAGGTDRVELVRQLVDHWGVDEDRASADVERFVQQLTDLDLLEPL